MVKNGRPFTNENGYEDSKLITDLDYVDDRYFDGITAVSEWIKANIRPSNTTYFETSYGLKHVLEKNIGVYLTNNQFKDAMWLAGFYPIDENELNWEYQIILTRDIEYNPNPFRKWLKRYTNAAYRDTPRGDLAYISCIDENFPAFAEYDILKRYYDNWSKSDYSVIDTFENLWKAYKERV